METLGFKAEHQGASGRGDDGIDVWATKSGTQGTEHWLVQCKCYSSKNKVDVRVARELLGAIRDKAPDVGARGMIVTTSDFTSGAREMANKHGIVLMNGEEFAKATSEEKARRGV
jgi:restriction endonuclease Mrr